MVGETTSPTSSAGALNGAASESPSRVESNGILTDPKIQAAIEFQEDIGRISKLPRAEQAKEYKKAVGNLVNKTGFYTLQNTLISARDAILNAAPEKILKLAESITTLAEEAGKKEIDVSHQSLLKQIEMAKEMFQAQLGLEVESAGWQAKAVGILKFVGVFAKIFGFGDGILNQARSMEADIDNERYDEFEKKFQKLKDSVINGNFSQEFGKVEQNIRELLDTGSNGIEVLADKYAPNGGGASGNGLGLPEPTLQ